nr:glutamine synthetase [Planctomycetota bacterium]
RLVDGFWAPTKPTWGVDNRTVAFRHISAGAKATRMESRIPGSDVNPYLAMAATVGAGLYGIEHKLPLTDEPITGSGYHAAVERLPRSLQEATKRLADSTIAREIFGSTFVDHFVQTREWEWRQFQDAVTDWELQRYFEII